MTLPIYKKELQERPYISFSEAHAFSTCPHKHWQIYREKIAREDTIYTVFGTAVGEAIEDFKKNNKKFSWISLCKKIFRFIVENEEWPEWVKEDEKDWRLWARSALRIFKDTLAFMDQTYPGWKLIDFEYELNEPIEGCKKTFKGYIDFIFEWKDKIYIFDFKTTKTGWYLDQRQDTEKLYQVILYKNYYCKKNNIDPKKIQCAYLLLKRQPPKKAESSVELFEQTSGNVKLRNAESWLKEQAQGIEKGISLRKVDTCSFCVCGKSNNKPGSKNKTKSK